ncbi:MAG: sulfatase [Planctomycetes bacterium]|nr:sulfatase [Planctomycetota bacterium]
MIPREILHKATHWRNVPFALLTLIHAIVPFAHLIAADKPNILWISCEDTGQQLGCYGDEYSSTPYLDAFAKKSQRYLNCWSNAPVCAPARTAIITGMYPPAFGAQHMRSEVSLPNFAKTIPEHLHSVGYYCSNNSKEDYNFRKRTGMWDDSSQKAHWRNRSKDQPFFSVFNLQITHESQIRKRPYQPKHPTSSVPIPPYHPDTPEVRIDWAQYYDRITEMDSQFQKILIQLEDDGLSESTIVFFFGDHGSGMPRSKRWLYESGLRVPMMVHIPSKFQSIVGASYQAGFESKRLVSFLDLAPTVLELAGLAQSAYLHGESFFSDEARARSKLIGFRDRMDERIDCSRAIRDHRYLYVRNFFPSRPQGAYLAYMFETPTTNDWYRCYIEGRLDKVQSRFWETKDVEELYDLDVDPHQVTNLAYNPAYQSQRTELGQSLKQWMLDHEDKGCIPEDWLLDGRLDSINDAIESAWRSGDVIDSNERTDIMLESTMPMDRYWGLVALHTQLSKHRRTVIPDTVPALITDSEDVVAIAALEILARYSTPEQATTSNEKLVQIAIGDKTTWGSRMLALNAIYPDALNQSTKISLEQIPEKRKKSWTKDLPSRYAEYLPRLIDHLCHPHSPKTKE